MIFCKSHAASYGRSKTIRICDCEFDVCSELRRCLGFDTSDKEYGDFWICESCMHLAVTDSITFEQIHKASPTKGEEEP